MLILPYRVDGPIDHRPWGTGAIIAANLLVAVLLGFPGDGGLIDAMPVKYGTLNPLTWVTAVFTHYGWGHVIGNVFFLWWFGVIVEGLVGWRKFVPLYLAIGVSVSAIVQILMLGADGQAAGASGAVFGTMAVAALWAPESKVETYVAVPISVLGLFRQVDFTVRGLAAIFVFFELFAVLILSFSMSSALVHVFGAAAGLGFGTWMLKNRLVDTGGWDWISLRKGRPTTIVAGPGPAPKAEESAADSVAAIRDALDGGNAIAADAHYVAVRKADPSFALPKDDFLRLVEALARANAPETAIERMEEYVATYPEAPVRLTLARLLVHARRPSRALEHLQAIEPATDGQREAKAALEAEARAALGTSALELE
ncbi:MAG TPA: rhomboid family intramembrane serine protease [Planctomycetota bacterium]|nr:rhomboid family intramembrane serine protease [Planctomycetota bacterium]